MKKLLTILFVAFALNSNAQYCISGGPSSAADSDFGAIVLNGETTNINIASTCPGTLGLEDLTLIQSADLFADSSYSITVDFNTCGGSFSNSGEVWIDFNINNLFDANESIGTWSGATPSGVQTFNFTIPAWVCNGNSRIRLSQQEGGSIPLDPCASFSWGSMIDATVVLSGGTCQIGGCTNPLALNYNPLATSDDGSCLLSAGQDCGNPNIITSLPFIQAGMTTNFYGSNYSSTDACGSDFMNGNDFVFEYTATSTECINVILGNTSNSTGVFLLDGCPDAGANCISQGNGSAANVSATINAGTYYIVVSNDNGFGPQFVDFDINISTTTAGSVGSTCGNPLIVTNGYSQTGLSTSCFGNDYSSTDACGSINMNGDDFVFEYIPTNDTCVTITLANATFTTGLFLIKNCPDAGYANCVSADIGSSATIIGASVEKDSVYYIIVSTDGFPNSTPFDISIQEIVCPTPNNQDCAGAINVCQDYFEPNYFNGVGNIPNEVPGSSCLGSGEKNNVWYQFTSHQTGNLGFTIFPNTPSDDYDWAVYDITDNGCNGVPSGLSTELSCNYSPNVCGPPGNGSTGPNGDLTGPCGGQNESLIPVDSGGTYAIVVSQFSDGSQDGFTIVFDTNSVISANKIDAQDKTINCGDDVLLNANFYGPVGDTLTYSWSPALLLADDPTLVHPRTIPLNDTTKYFIHVKNGDCELTDSLVITVTFADFTTLQDTSLCFGVEYRIIPEYKKNIIVDSLSFTWSPNIKIDNVNDSTPTILAFDTITYNVEIVNGICVEYDSVTIIVMDSLASAPSFFINDNFESGGVAEVEFYNESVGSSLVHFWDFADGSNADIRELFHVYEEDGTYPVMLRVTDTLGCTDSVIVDVKIPLLELPNIFTPNGDDKNEIFFIKRLRPETNLKIYNRWGTLVFEDIDYKNTFDGGDLIDGTYYAELSYQKGSEIIIYKGFFNINR